MNSWIQTTSAKLTILKKWLCTLCGFETEKIKVDMEIMKSQLEAENQTLKSHLQALQTLEELRRKLQESGVTDEKIASSLKTLSKETLPGKYFADIRAAEWIEMKSGKWASEAVLYLNENHSDMVSTATKEDLTQDILNYLSWIIRSLRQGDYQQLDIVPSISYPFPYQRALQFILDKEDTDGLSSIQAVKDLKECFVELLDRLGKKRGKKEN